MYHVGVKGKACLSGSNWLVSEKLDAWIVVNIPSFTTLGTGMEYSVDDPSLVQAGRGSSMSDDGATGSTGGNFQESVESCWTERPGLQPAVWFP
jgi:hypothetical protein